MPLRRSTIINPTLLRHIHAARIFHAIRRHPNMSQREIGAAAGADRSTVSAVIQDFQAMGLIERATSSKLDGKARSKVGEKSDRRPGRPGEAIALSSRGGLLIGVHLRPQGITYAASGLDGESLRELRRPLPGKIAELGREVKSGIGRIIAALGRTPEEVRAVGVAAPGLVRRDGVLSQSPNLGWHDVDLRGMISPHVKAPLFIENNANAATIAEYMFGRGFEAGDFAYVESGSGVGAGLFLDGALYRGALGFAGEFGHTKIVPDGRICRCGNLGCVSAYASDYSIIQRLRQAERDVSSREDVLEAAEQGDPQTLAVLAEAGRLLGRGLSNIVNLLNVQHFILGGGLAVFARFILPSIRQAIGELSLAAAAEGCTIESSTLGDRGGIAVALEGCTSLHSTEAAPW